MKRQPKSANTQFISKSTEIDIEMKNLIVDNAIHRIKDIEKQREHIEEAYHKGKEALDAMIAKFEPTRIEYEQYDQLVEKQQRIIDIYTKGKTKRESLGLRRLDSGTIIIEPKPEKKHLPPINWMKIITDMMKEKKWMNASFPIIWEWLSQDRNLAHQLMERGIKFNGMKTNVFNSLEAHCNLHNVRKTGIQLLKKDEKGLYTYA